MAAAARVCATPRSRRSRHRFGQVRACPAQCPLEPQIPRGEMQPVPCGARSDTRLLSASIWPPRSAQIRSVRRLFNTILSVYFEVKTVFAPLGHVWLSPRKISNGLPTRAARGNPCPVKLVPTLDLCSSPLFLMSPLYISVL